MTTHTPGPMPPSLHRTDALRAALHRFCDAAATGYAAGAQAARDEALLRIPVTSIYAAKAAILDYQLVYMEAKESGHAALANGDFDAMNNATANLSKIIIRLAQLEVEPR